MKTVELFRKDEPGEFQAIEDQEIVNIPEINDVLSLVRESLQRIEAPCQASYIRVAPRS